MLTVEELKKFTKLTTQDAWRQEMNTTLNDMVEYICFRVGEKLLENFNEDLNNLKTYMSDSLAEYDTEIEALKEGLKENASKDGGIQKPQRSKKAGT